MYRVQKMCAKIAYESIQRETGRIIILLLPCYIISPYYIQQEPNNEKVKIILALAKVFPFMNHTTIHGLETPNKGFLRQAKRKARLLVITFVRTLLTALREFERFSAFFLFVTPHQFVKSSNLIKLMKLVQIGSNLFKLDQIGLK